MRERLISQGKASINFYPGGVLLNVPATVDLPRKGGGERGEIRGWSKASRRRMRNFLLTHEAVPGNLLFGVTYTIPGNRCTDGGKLLPPPSPEECRHLFNHFQKNFLSRNGCGMVWRLEIQTRGYAHWHGLVSCPPKLDGFYPADFMLKKYWLDALPVLGKFNFLQVWQSREVILNDRYHSDVEGAGKKAADVQHEGGRGSWLRYLQDHATKAKQEQVAIGFGRHWGVVGRTQFQNLKPDGSHEFTSRKSLARFLRMYHRLIRPVVSYRKRRELSRKFDSRPFEGRSLGFCSNRGSIGASVWFSKPETVRKLVEWSEKMEESKTT